MAKQWRGLLKVSEELNELGVELMKLGAFPTGKHPGRKRSVVLSVEDEAADVLNALNYFIDRNGLDRARIDRRTAAKRKKFIKWMGEIKPAKSKATKKTPKALSNASRAR